MENNNSLINSVAAAAADISFSAGTLTISVDARTFPSLVWDNVKSFSKTTGVAETLQTNTVTYTPANSTTYELSITQSAGAANGAPTTVLCSYTSDATATDLEIATAFVNLINAQSELKVTCTDAGGANTITLTADAGYPFFTATAIAGMAVVAGATGVSAKGIGDDLITAGVSGAASGTTYTKYVFEYYVTTAPQMALKQDTGLSIHTLYVNQGDGDFAAFDTKLRTEIFGKKWETEFGVETQITSVTTGVTLSVLKGVITTFSHTAAAYASNTFTVTNTYVGANSKVNAWIQNYSGTFTTNGLPTVYVDNVTAGAFDITVSNLHNANALSGTLAIGFQVLAEE